MRDTERQREQAREGTTTDHTFKDVHVTELTVGRHMATGNPLSSQGRLAGINTFSSRAISPASCTPCFLKKRFRLQQYRSLFSKNTSICIYTKLYPGGGVGVGRERADGKEERCRKKVKMRVVFIAPSSTPHIWCWVLSQGPLQSKHVLEP